MKKSIIFFAALYLAIGMVGCSGNAPSIAASGSSETQESSNYQTSTSDPNNATTDDADLPSNNVGCFIAHRFGSVKDMDTYFTTGSTDLADYQFEPGTLLVDMPNPDLVTRVYAYHSLYEFFKFDEADFASVEAYFTFANPGNVTYKYFLDNIFITIEPTDSTDLLAYYKSRENIVSDDEIIPYAKDVGSTAKHMFREDPACNVMYYMVNGIKKTAHLILGECYITINCTSNYKEDSLFEDFDEFMANPKAAAFSAFFSDNDSVFHNAVKAALSNSPTE